MANLTSEIERLLRDIEATGDIPADLSGYDPEAVRVVIRDPYPEAPKIRAVPSTKYKPWKSLKRDL